MMLLTLLMAAGALEIRGETRCPTSAQVEAALSGLLPASDGERRRVELTSEPQALLLRLWSADGRVEASRSVPLSTSCEALARASAVTIATWARQGTQLSAPPVLAATATVTPSEPMFQRNALEHMKLLAAAPEPEPLRTRGAAMTIAIAAAMQVAGIALAASSEHDTGRMVAGTALAVGGRGAALFGLLWLMRLVGLAREGATLEF